MKVQHRFKVLTDAIVEGADVRGLDSDAVGPFTLELRYKGPLRGPFTMSDDPEYEHYRWVIDRRSKVQMMLLRLYKLVRTPAPAEDQAYRDRLIDDFIAAAFSLWRAIFLVDQARDAKSVQQAHERFLRTVISTNTVTFSDDRNTSSWSATYYLENASHRCDAAMEQIVKHNPESEKYFSQFGNMDVEPNHGILVLRRGWDGTFGMLDRCVSVFDGSYDPEKEHKLRIIKAPTPTEHG